MKRGLASVAFAATFASALVASCTTRATTAMLAVLATDLPVSNVVLRVETEGELVACLKYPVDVRRRARPEEGPPYALPASVAIQPAAGVDPARARPVTLVASAYAGAIPGDACTENRTRPLVRQEARVGYLEGESFDVVLPFTASCVGVACDSGTTCREGACVSSARDARTAPKSAEGAIRVPRCQSASGCDAVHALVPTERCRYALGGGIDGERVLPWVRFDFGDGISGVEFVLPGDVDVDVPGHAVVLGEALCGLVDRGVVREVGVATSCGPRADQPLCTDSRSDLRALVPDTSASMDAGRPDGAVPSPDAASDADSGASTLPDSGMDAGVDATLPSDGGGDAGRGSDGSSTTDGNADGSPPTDGGSVPDGSSGSDGGGTCAEVCCGTCLGESCQPGIVFTARTTNPPPQLAFVTDGAPTARGLMAYVDEDGSSLAYVLAPGDPGARQTIPTQWASVQWLAAAGDRVAALTRVSPVASNYHVETFLAPAPPTAGATSAAREGPTFGIASDATSVYVVERGLFATNYSVVAFDKSTLSARAVDLGVTFASAVVRRIVGANGHAFVSFDSRTDSSAILVDVDATATVPTARTVETTASGDRTLGLAIVRSSGDEWVAHARLESSGTVATTLAFPVANALQATPVPSAGAVDMTDLVSATSSAGGSFLLWSGVNSGGRIDALPTSQFGSSTPVQFVSGLGGPAGLLSTARCIYWIQPSAAGYDVGATGNTL
ncbi:MAG: hypothetical protein U0169_17445 [Polyangiaceae bacterium]